MRNLLEKSKYLLQEITLLDALVCILEDQAQRQEELEMVFSIMATHYKKLENQSMGFHISIDWVPKEFLDYSAINKQSEEALKKVKHIHAFHEHPIWAKRFESSHTSFGLSNSTIIQELKKTSSNLPSGRYQALEGDTFVIQKNSSYVRKIKIGGDVVGILADLIQEEEPAMKMMAAEMAPSSSEYFDERLLRRILYYLMDTNIRSFAELNTKSEKFEQFFKEIANYCEQQDVPMPRIGDIRDIQRRFHDLDRGKPDSSESINTVYEQYRFNKEKLQQTLTGGKKDT